MLDDLIIDFVGPGVMAEAIVRGMIERAGVSPDQIRMSGPRQKRLDDLSKAYSVSTTTDNHESVQGADVIVIAVKPQTLNGALKDLKGAIADKALVLSIVAGERLYYLSWLALP